MRRAETNASGSPIHSSAGILRMLSLWLAGRAARHIRVINANGSAETGVPARACAATAVARFAASSGSAHRPSCPAAPAH